MGKAEIKRAITNVLDAVINNYNYTSLPDELSVTHSLPVFEKRIIMVSLLIVKTDK